MPLVDWQIDKLVFNNQLIEPYNKEQLNPASYDVLVGKNALIEVKDSFGTWLQKKLWQQMGRFDLIESLILTQWRKLDLSAYTKESPYYLKPRDFVLLELQEYIKLPNNITGDFVLKSSRAREGWNHSLASFCDPGYQGRLTLEVENLRRYALLPLYKGLKIGQLIFTECEHPERPYSVTGRYYKDQFVQKSKG